MWLEEQRPEAPVAPDFLAARSIAPYLPRLAVEWAAERPEEAWQVVDGSLVFVDISGFTKLSERLARRGRIGAEELTEALGSVFARMLADAYRSGGHLLKFGGDALLLLFDGESHEDRACRAVIGMSEALRTLGRLETSVGRVTLRMSAGVNSGPVHFFRVGSSHRELVVAGPVASALTQLEAAANAGEILIGPVTAAAATPNLVGAAKGPGHLLRSRRHEPALGAAPVVSNPIDLLDHIPVALREHLLEGGVDSEHRNATVAFLHFDGTDDLLAAGDPEVVAEALHELVSDVQGAADEVGVTFLGTDLSRNGGKIILVAGAPRAQEDDAGRMLLALRRVVEVDRLVPIRIGVNRGHVFAGGIGPEYRRTYTVMGDTVNLAARLMAHARSGQILAHPSVVDRAGPSFATVALEPFAVKGKAEPVDAFDVGELVEQPEQHERGSSPLVGREEELETLLDLADGARARRGALVELVGATGIGKTRLVEELEQRTPDLTHVQVVSEPYAASTPYLPFRKLLRDLLGIRSSDPHELAGQRLRERVETNASELLPWLPLLADVLNIDLADTPETASLAPRFRKVRLEWVMSDFLGAVMPTPTVLAFEDVHWMDGPSSELLHRLATNITHRPWLVCVTRRGLESGFVPRDEETTARLTIDALSEDAATAIVHAATHHAPLRPHEVEALTRTAAGNPLFLEELVHVALETGSTEALPESIDAVVTSEIDRLPPASRRLLRYCAVLGRTFRSSTLRAIVHDEFDVDDPAWGPLEVFLRDEGDGLLHFRHALIRDAAYESLSFRRRRELHARAGEAIEQSLSSRLDDYAELLSLHFFEAHEHAKAWRYARRAAERSVAAYANVDAAEHYERALAAARALPDLTTLEVATVAEALGDVRDRAGVYDAATSAYRQARALLAGDVVRQARLMLKEAWLAERQSRFANAVRWIRRGLRALEGVAGEDASTERAQLTVAYAAIRQGQGRCVEAIEWCHRAIAEATASKNLVALASAYATLDWAYVDLGQSDRAVHSSDALRIYEELGDLDGQALVANNLGANSYYAGRWADALALYERSRDAAMQLGDSVNAMWATMNVGEVLADQGHLDDAEEHMRDALRVWKAAGYSRGVAYATMYLARVAGRTGRHTEALELLDDARAAFGALGAETDVLQADVVRAECDVLGGDPGSALARIDDALVRLDHVPGGEGQRAPLFRLRGYALAQRGRIDEAATALDESLRVAREIGADYEVALTLEAQARVGALAGTDEEPALAERHTIFERLGVGAVPEVVLGDSTFTRS